MILSKVKEWWPARAPAPLVARDHDAYEDIARQKKTAFPAQRIVDAASALCLFGAVSEGKSDLVHVFDANVPDVLVVDGRSDKLAIVQKVFPVRWAYERALPLEACRECLEQHKRFDVVIADGSRVNVDNFWEDVVVGALALAKRCLIARITADYLAEYEFEATPQGVQELLMHLHGVDVPVGELVKRSSGNGGTFWAVVNGCGGSRSRELGGQWGSRHGAAIDDGDIYGLDRAVALRDDLDVAPCIGSAECRVNINAFRRSIYEHERTGVFRGFTRASFARLPRARVEGWRYASAIFALNRFTTMDEVWEATRLATSKRGTVNRKVARARREGYFVKRIDRRQYIPDIYDVNTSAEYRGGKAMRANYRRSIEDMGGHPTQPYPFEWPACRTHASLYWGVFLAEPGRMSGSVQVDDRLVGYINLVRTGNSAAYSAILGHAEHLKHGIMYLLHFSIVEDAMNGLLPGLEYLRYTGMASRGEGGGLMQWKQRCLFEPRFVLYDDAGEWRGPAGMTYLSE